MTHADNPPPRKDEAVATRQERATAAEGIKTRIKYKHEFGKRWNERLPRDSIKYIVNRIPCWTDDETVVEMVLTRCQASKIPENMLGACKRYALLVHARQKDLYYAVLRGDMR